MLTTSFRKAVFIIFTVSVAAPLLLGGCSNLSGVDGESDFKCKAPDGVQCQSISGTYANVKAGNYPGGRTVSTASAGAPSNAPVAVAVPKGQAQLTLPAARNMVPGGLPPTYMGAIRSEPTVLRTWVMTYEDSDGDVVDQTYIYLALDSGRWMLERNRQFVEDAFSPSRPMGTNASSNTSTSPSALTAAKPASPAPEASSLSTSVIPRGAEVTGDSTNVQEVLRSIQKTMGAAPTGGRSPVPAEEVAK